MRLKLFLLFGIWCRLLSAQVPHVEPNYALNIIDWWQIHPMNPEGKNYQSQIVSPEPVIELRSGQSINAAIARLPATGGTIKLGPGNYRSFQIIGRSNIHIIAEGNAIINHAGSLAASPEFLKYEQAGERERWLYYFHNKAALARIYADPPRNFYFKGLTFDGENKFEKALTVVRMSDLVFDNCTFRNYRNDAKESRAIYQFIVGKYLVNAWFLRVYFDIKMTHVACLSSSSGCGFLHCVMGKNISAGIGFSDNYFVMAHNVFHGRGSALAYIGSNGIIKNNIRHGNVRSLVEISEPVITEDFAGNKNFHWQHGLNIHVINNQVDQIDESIVRITRYRQMSEIHDYDCIRMEQTLEIKDNRTKIKQETVPITIREH